MLKAKNNNASHLKAVFPCELITLDSQNRPSTKFTYIDVFPINLEDLQYTVQGDSIEITCTVTFQYNKFIVKTKDGEVIDDTWNGDL